MAGNIQVPAGAQKVDADAFEILRLVAQFIGNQGVLTTSLAGSNTSQVVFQNAAAAVGNGTAFTVGGLRTLVVEVFGATSPAGTVSFMGASKSGTYAPISGTRLDTLA